MNAATETYTYRVTGNTRKEIHKNAKVFAEGYFGTDVLFRVHNVTVAASDNHGYPVIYHADCIAWMPEEASE